MIDDLSIVCNVSEFVIDDKPNYLSNAEIATDVTSSVIRYSGNAYGDKSDV